MNIKDMNVAVAVSFAVGNASLTLEVKKDGDSTIKGLNVEKSKNNGIIDVNLRNGNGGMIK